jgi:hypothetical protein
MGSFWLWGVMMGRLGFGRFCYRKDRDCRIGWHLCHLLPSQKGMLAKWDGNKSENFVGRRGKRCSVHFAGQSMLHPLPFAVNVVHP